MIQDNYNTHFQQSRQIGEMLRDQMIDSNEHTILSILLHKTIGYKKTSDGISISQWMEAAGGWGKEKTVKVLKSLEGKKLIKKSRQSRDNGGHGYSRYSLTPLVLKSNKGSSKIEQGLVLKSNTQLTDLTSNERENACAGNYFNQNEKAIKQYINERAANKKDQEAYAVSMLSVFMDDSSSKHKATVIAFEAWKARQGGAA